MIFRLSTCLTLALLLAITILLIWKLGLISEDDREVYSELVSLSNLKSERNEKKEPYKASQDRRNVVKEFFIQEGSERHLLRIESSKSSLSYAEQEAKKELVEHMEDLVCLMQEELYFLLPDGSKVHKGEVKEELGVPMQIIRRLEAASADYFYQTEDFTAQNVKLERFIVPGQSLEDPRERGELILSGEAQNVSLSLAGNGLKFHADHLKATVQ